MGRMLSVVDGERVVVETFEVGEPGPGEVLIRVNRTQVSAGSEKGRFRGASRAGSQDHLSAIWIGRRDTPPRDACRRSGPAWRDFEIGDRVFASGQA